MLHLSLLQLDLRWENHEANRQHIETMLQGASQTDVIVLPEMFTTGFSMNPAPLAEEMHGRTMQWMKGLAKQHQALVMGSIIIMEGGQYYNRFVAMGPQGTVTTYDKRHCFRMAGEHEHYEPGQKRVVFSYKGWRICPQICYDLRFPVWSRTHSGPDGPDYDLLIYVANWPSPRVTHWDALLKARAIENQAFVVGVNRIGVDGSSWSYPGHSVALDPLGKVLVQGGDQEALLSATFDLEQIRAYRTKFPVWKDADKVE